jgi:hypothetical protein
VDEPDLTTAPVSQDTHAAGGATGASSDEANPYALPTLLVFGALTVLGLVAGVLSWRSAPETYPANDPAANAITLHWALAGLAAAATALVCARARRRGRRQVLSLPFRVRALGRVRATLRLGGFDLLRLARAALTLLLLYVLLWEPFRAAMQVFAALAPSWTANAWGGPSYWGASLAHWLDGYLLFYAAALILNVVLVRTPRQD